MSRIGVADMKWALVIFAIFTVLSIYQSAMEKPREFVLLVLILGGPWLAIKMWEWSDRDKKFRKQVEQHKIQLRAGGLIPRVDRSVHQQALREISLETPNVQLPRRQYYD